MVVCGHIYMELGLGATSDVRRSCVGVARDKELKLEDDTCVKVRTH
jgi:hypothetical protein